MHGFGWEDVWAAKIGIPQDLGKKTKVRLGYTYIENPAPTDAVFFSIPAPVIANHHIAAGVPRELREHVTLNLVYWYALMAHQTGPVIGPDNNPVPGSEVEEQPVRPIDCRRLDVEVLAPGRLADWNPLADG